jgi:hypothetical protein
MADNAHGFEVLETVVKIGFHKNNQKNVGIVELAQSSYLSNVLYSTSLHTRSFTG